MSTTSSRADALDALRGLAIIGMILSGQLPFHEFVLPDWMYHAQVPPPDHKFIPTLPGITWVDLVFPFFLFAMGAAFPLALSKKIAAGVSKWKISFSILERGILLGFFALYVQAIRPYVMSTNPDTMTWLVSIAAFLFLFPMYVRLPETWNKFLLWGVKSAGWICAILFFVLTTYPDGSGFKLTRSDIIIVVLTNMAVFGAFTWIITRDNLLLRLGLLGVLMAIRLSNMPAGIEGWVNDIWRWTPIPWMYTLYYQQYLFIVIPGTILGDMILRYMRTNNPATLRLVPDKKHSGLAQGEQHSAGRQLPTTNYQLPITDNQWSFFRYILIALLMLLFNIELLVGLFARYLIETTFFTIALCAAGYWMMNKPLNEREKLYRELFHWAIFWLVLGLFFEPYEGGIKKDKATVSYYFITSGLAICTYIFFSVVIDVLKKKRAVQLLIDNGQNPMIAYAGINNFVIPLLGVTGILSVMNSLVTTPFLGFLKGLIVTLLLMLVTSFCTKKKIFWRT